MNWLNSVIAIQMATMLVLAWAFVYRGDWRSGAAQGLYVVATGVLFIR